MSGITEFLFIVPPSQRRPFAVSASEPCKVGEQLGRADKPAASITCSCGRSATLYRSYDQGGDFLVSWTRRVGLYVCDKGFLPHRTKVSHNVVTRSSLVKAR